MRVGKLILLLGVTSILAVSPLSAGLIAFYSFEGNANDVSGNGNNGTVSGATLTSGYEGQGYSFNGSGNYIQIPVNINPGVRPQLTMGAWALSNSTAPVRAVISHDDGGYDRNLNMDNRGSCGSSACWSAFTGTGVLAGPAVTTAQWVFLAVRYDANAGTVTLDVGAARSSLAANPGSGNTITRIGSNPGYGEYFSGVIDNVFIYDEILTNERIDQIRLGGAGAILPAVGIPEPSTILMAVSGLVAAWLVRRRAARPPRA